MDYHYIIEDVHAPLEYFLACAHLYVEIFMTDTDACDQNSPSLNTEDP